MKTHIITIAAMAAAMLAGCNRVEPEEVLLTREDISLTIKGTDQVSFNRNDFQLGFNDQRNEFRVVNDRLAQWFVLQCSATPVHEGQEITGTLEYTTDTVPKRLDNLSFIVQKISDDGLIWLWNSSRKIGIVVKII